MLRGPDPVPRSNPRDASVLDGSARREAAAPDSRSRGPAAIDGRRGLFEAQVQERRERDRHEELTEQEQWSERTGADVERGEQ